MSIGSKIKALRRAKDLTQEELAEVLGVSSKAVSQWECGRTAPDISQLPVLCNFFEVTADELLEIDVFHKTAERDKSLHCFPYCLNREITALIWSIWQILTRCRRGSTQNAGIKKSVCTIWSRHLQMLSGLRY